MTGFCRDCLAPAGAGPRCGACGSPRLLRHAELDQLSIAHIDCDAFYAAVEKRDRPELRDRPVIIGGGRRGVVSTACYIARVHGVRSAMPMFKALQACPQAVVVRPDMAKYAVASKAVRERMLAVTPLVEPLSLDEAFLDLTGTERLHRAPPALILARLARQIEQEVGVTVSIGLSYCKFLAKLASDMEKPRGFTVIGRAEAVALLAERRVSDIWGVGKSLLARLEADGIQRIGHLARYDEAHLIGRYGSIGRRLWRFSRGEDDRRVEPEREAKGVSAETTFEDDIAAFETLGPIVWRLAEKVSARLKKAGVAARTATLKLKTDDFRLRTRSVTLDRPTQLAEAIYKAVEPLLRLECRDGLRYRLAGIGASNLAPPEPEAPSLLATPDRAAEVERAVDAVRAKFGAAAIGKGRGLPVSSPDPETARSGSARPSGRSPRSPAPGRR